MYSRQHIPRPQLGLGLRRARQLHPGKQETCADYTINDRAPLLFIGGSQDRIMPPAVNEANAHKYAKSTALTDHYEFEGRDHWMGGVPG